MPVTLKSFSDIYSGISDFLESNASALTDLNVGSRLYALTRAVSSAISLGWVGLSEIRDLFYIQTSTGKDLDRRIGDFGMLRNPGAFAGGKILVYSANTGLSVTAGDRVQTLNGDRTYEIIESVAITPPFTAVSVIADDVGYKYNLAAGTRLVANGTSLDPTLTFVVGEALDLEGKATGAITGGVSIESDEDVRSRFGDYLKSLSRGTALAILQALRGTPGVGTIVLQEATPIPGWITVTVADSSGNLPEPLKDTIEQVLIDWGCAGMGYIIQPVIQVTYDIAVTVYAKENPDISMTDLQSAVSTKLSDELAKVTLGESVYNSTINKIAFLDDYDIVRVEVETPTHPGVIANPGDLLAVDNITVEVIYV